MLDFPKLRPYRPRFTPGGGHVDPSTIDVEDLRKIRGDMWPAILPGTGWERILAMAFYDLASPDERKAMLDLYTSYGWTHAVTGPMVDPNGYHGKYPAKPNVPTQDEWDHYLDCMQEWWDAGVIPIHFLKPDNWSLDAMDALAHLYQQSRAQRLLRMIVPVGWEPGRYELSADTWAAMIRKVRGWFADAPEPTLFYIHTVCDVDAPTGDGDNFPNGNGGAWDRVGPLIHGWLIQNGPYETKPKNDPETARNFGDQFDFKTAAPHSIAWHFVPPHGNAGWPCISAWGAGIPVDLIAAEQTAYRKFWHHMSEDDAMDWGDLAIARGAMGALDGCRMPGREG
jgi:hypothetical protein